MSASDVEIVRDALDALALGQGLAYESKNDWPHNVFAALARMVERQGTLEAERDRMTVAYQATNAAYGDQVRRAETAVARAAELESSGLTDLTGTARKLDKAEAEAARLRDALTDAENALDQTAMLIQRGSIRDAEPQAKVLLPVVSYALIVARAALAASDSTTNEVVLPPPEPASVLADLDTAPTKETA